MATANCAYCNGPGGHVIWSDDRCRVLLIPDAPFSGLSRVVWNEHVAEVTDLGEADRAHLFKVLATVEQGLRDLLKPAKINLAALGTAMPHLHWHVIPRFPDDSHFPEPIWAAAIRPPGPRKEGQDFAGVFGKLLTAKLGASSAAI